MKRTDKKFMGLALAKARAGVDRGQTPFGACIVKNNSVVVMTHNKVWKTTDITAHAEVVAIREACKKLRTIDLSGCTIYSTCEPCPMCFSACHWARIDRIVFGATICDAKRYGFNELKISNGHLKAKGKTGVILSGQVLRKESQKLFRYWQKKNGQKTY
jgi:tRNA(Arg) A34 adenosine deaminase TadA